MSASEIMTATTLLGGVIGLILLTASVGLLINRVVAAVVAILLVSVFWSRGAPAWRKHIRLDLTTPSDLSSLPPIRLMPHEAVRHHTTRGRTRLQLTLPDGKRIDEDVLDVDLQINTGGIVEIHFRSFPSSPEKLHQKSAPIMGYILQGASDSEKFRPQFEKILQLPTHDVPDHSEGIVVETKVRGAEVEYSVFPAHRKPGQYYYDFSTGVPKR